MIDPGTAAMIGSTLTALGTGLLTWRHAAKVDMDAGQVEQLDAAQRRHDLIEQLYAAHARTRAEVVARTVPPGAEPVHELGQQDPVGWIAPDGSWFDAQFGPLSRFQVPQPAQPTMDLVADEATGTRPKAAAPTTVAASGPQPPTSTLSASSRRRRVAEVDDDGLLVPPRWYRLRRAVLPARAWNRYITRLADDGRLSNGERL